MRISGARYSLQLRRTTLLDKQPSPLRNYPFMSCNILLALAPGFT